MNSSHIIESKDSVQGIITQLKHYLPSQSPLKDFVHHNSLHAFQDKSFFEGIFNARDIFGYNVTLNIAEFRNLYQLGRINHDVLKKIIIDYKGADQLNVWLDKLLKEQFNFQKDQQVGKIRRLWKSEYKIDLDNRVHPLLFRIICAYLDQGVSIWNFPDNGQGFLENLRIVASNSYSSFFKSSRAKALFMDDKVTTEHLLSLIVGDKIPYFNYLFDQQFAHRGWSGMVSAIEDNPSSLLDAKKVQLTDFIHLELLLEIDALDQQFGTRWLPLSATYTSDKYDFFAINPIATEDEVLMLFQEAFEWSYYDQVLFSFKSKYATTKDNDPTPNFQAVFCIDERECSLRRHLEKVAAPCSTFGAPGFFGVEFYFQPQNGKFYEKLCPAPVTPKYLIKEFDSLQKRPHSIFYHKIADSFIGGIIFSMTAGIISIFELIRNLFFPKMTPAISDAFSHVEINSTLTIENKSPNDMEQGLQIGFTIAEMTQRVESQLRNMGLIHNFTAIVYIVAHGSSSANNPHHGAHDCGACSGRPGSVNARVFSTMANHNEVRKALHENGIHIPETTWFVGALHDTAADQIKFYDTDKLPTALSEKHKLFSAQFETALDLNAHERSRRFASINTKANLKEVRKEIKNRSVSLFEPRPELGHGSNALCIIGRRAITKNIFLDRRAFLNSYDYTIDPTGDILAKVISPIGPVCGGINLEYYFSRIDNQKLGAGTKLPHNVMGLIGVSNSSDGDLRPGLPLQMIEVHDPVRLLVVVEQVPDIVLKVVKSSENIYNWYSKQWIHLVVINPMDGQLYQFKNDQFVPYDTVSINTEKVQNFQQLFENATEMSAFTIENATTENLPIYYLN
ncbi:MAG: DUF2309 domain-containing protein [Chitinophagaceae bacterium]|nr:DUF2309 domain-containing protein [Chitinophagaceae bacterium]